jgi:hypothetical protein
VPVYGYWGVKDGIMTYCGIPRRGRNPQRAYNYHHERAAGLHGERSEVAVDGSGSGDCTGLKELWDRSAIESRAYLPYHDVDE